MSWTPWDQSSRITYRVQYARKGWQMKDGRKATRFYESEAAMVRFVDKLLGDGRPDLEPIVTLRVSARPVGDWFVIDERRITDDGDDLEDYVVVDQGDDIDRWGPWMEGFAW